MTEPARPSPAAVSVEDQAIHWDADLSYATYLQLQPLLSLQQPRSEAHDELMFIIVHQASELWMKLAIAELAAAMIEIGRGNPGPAFKMLARVSRIQVQLTESWAVLSTLTPADYSAFRGSLGQSSGFQSPQYRQLEFMLGNKNPALIRAHQQNPAAYALLERVLHEPSVYDLSLRLLHTSGLKLPTDVIERNFSIPYSARPEVEAAWAEVYRDPQAHWDLYELAEKLVDVEHQFQTWRFSHMKTVERIIGHKRGTGGSSGVSYLVRALDLRFFPELWTVRTRL
ncbi:MAG: tryptophan 2,3-dioxygenase [Sinobacteraceae bacterium]|nr:tryptophan 2,3-dioxygenase [Nevskiaceae bacterium]